ncbi:MAG: metallophosphoesterase, partial [Candidatus Heimdallarchaeota archaeon]|nr:metallophosphoesterase [Candidatus Heimdallarchaeota archaeon]
MRICAIGDPHGSLDKIKEIPLSDIDLILLTGDLGSSDLMRKMAFDNLERKEQGLEEVKYSPTQKKKAFMEAYTSTMRIVKYLQKFAP